MLREWHKKGDLTSSFTDLWTAFRQHPKNYRFKAHVFTPAARPHGASRNPKPTLGNAGYLRHKRFTNNNNDKEQLIYGKGNETIKQ